MINVNLPRRGVFVENFQDIVNEGSCLISLWNCVILANFRLWTRTLLKETLSKEHFLINNLCFRTTIVSHKRVANGKLGNVTERVLIWYSIWEIQNSNKKPPYDCKSIYWIYFIVKRFSCSLPLFWLMYMFPAWIPTCICLHHLFWSWLFILVYYDSSRCQSEFSESFCSFLSYNLSLDAWNHQEQKKRKKGDANAVSRRIVFTVVG